MLATAAEHFDPTPDEGLLEEIKGAPSSVLDTLRWRFCRDLYFACKGVLGYRDLTPRTHLPMCRYIASSSAPRRLTLVFRGVFKTSIATVGDSVRLVADDPEHRLLISQETATKAEEILDEIKGHWTRNQLLRTLFPHIAPTKTTGPGVDWGSSSATVQREGNYKEPTYTAVGVGVATVGRHYTRIKCDDLIGLEAKRYPNKMQEAITWVKDLDPALLRNPNSDIIDFIGTRKKIHDLYKYLMERYGERLEIFRMEPIVNGEPTFPERWSMETMLELQRSDPEFWHAEMVNSPIELGDHSMDPNLIRDYRFNDRGEVVYQREGREQRWPLDALDRVMACDPNSGKKSATDDATITVVGTSPRDERFVLESWGGKPSAPEYVDLIFQKAARWRPRVVGIEEAGQQTTEQYFRIKRREEGLFVRVEPLKPRNRVKEQRILHAVQPLVLKGKLYMLPSQTALRKQIEFYPDVDNDDFIDGLAYTTELSRVPQSSEEEDEAQDLVKKILASRNSRTGY